MLAYRNIVNRYFMFFNDNGVTVNTEFGMMNGSVRLDSNTKDKT